MMAQTVPDLMRGIGRAARAAAAVLATASAEQRNQALMAAAAALRGRRAEISAANESDMRHAAHQDLSRALLDRLLLDDQRIDAMALGLEDIAKLADPIGRRLAEWSRPNGLGIQRVSGGAMLEIQQCRHPARRLGKRPLERGDPCLPGAGARSRGPAANLHSA